MLTEMCGVAGMLRGSLECVPHLQPRCPDFSWAAPVHSARRRLLAWCQRARLSRGRVAARLSGADVLGCIWTGLG